MLAFWLKYYPSELFAWFLGLSLKPANSEIEIKFSIKLN